MKKILGMIWFGVLAGSFVLSFVLYGIEPLFDLHAPLEKLSAFLFGGVFLPSVFLTISVGVAAQKADETGETGWRWFYQAFLAYCVNLAMAIGFILLFVGLPVLLPLGYLNGWIRDFMKRATPPEKTPVVPNAVPTPAPIPVAAVVPPQLVAVASPSGFPSPMPVQQALPGVAPLPLLDREAPVEDPKEMDDEPEEEPRFGTEWMDRAHAAYRTWKGEGPLPPLPPDPHWAPWVETVESHRRKNPCPKCGSEDIALLLFGHFGWRGVYMAEIQKTGLIHLGGCFVTQNDLHCNSCGHEFITFDDSGEIAPWPDLIVPGGSLSLQKTHEHCVKCGQRTPLKRLHQTEGGLWICFHCLGEERRIGYLG